MIGLRIYDRTLLTIAVFAVVTGLSGGLAHSAPDGKAAPPSGGELATCQVFEIRASNEAGGTDAALDPLKKKLTRPPFSAWKRFAVLKRHDASAEKMKAVDLALVPGGKLSLLFRDRSAGDKARLRLTFTLDGKNGKRLFNGTVSLDGGDYSLIGGESLDHDATYIIAVTCH